MSVVYTTINGMIVHENRGGVESFYAPDTMGSTVALLNSSGVVTDTYSYWPYGEIRSHVGSSQTPFTFLGMIGYYADVVANFIYVRARYLRQALTRWQTVDPLWPNEQAYGYCLAGPVSAVDPSGASTAVLPARPIAIPPAVWQAIIADLTAAGLALAEIAAVLLAIIAIGNAIGFACAELRKQRYKACPFNPGASGRNGNPNNMRGCKQGMDCLETLRLLHAWADCLASQIAIDFLCFGGIQHGSSTTDYMNNVLRCAKVLPGNCATVQTAFNLCFGQGGV